MIIQEENSSFKDFEVRFAALQEETRRSHRKSSHFIFDTLAYGDLIARAHFIFDTSAYDGRHRIETEWCDMDSSAISTYVSRA